MKKVIIVLLIFTTFLGVSFSTFAKSETNNVAEYVSKPDFSFDAKSVVLMEASTGTVLFEQNPDEARSPASVTKIMTLLLVMEALAEERIKLDDKVSISQNAASMGGSQVFLEEGETMCVEELIKCTVIASANDAAVALAEHIGGSESAFVTLMNTRAKQMGLKNTSFENVTGLDDTTEYHLTSARDIALMSKELIKYPIITQYASIWQDTIRNGEFTLTNTNRLVRYYDGCNGLKTGSTDKAGYCVSATAVRDGMQLIAVIMGAETRDERNNIARTLLDYGFSNYALFKTEECELEKITLKGAKKNETMIYNTQFSIVVPKSEVKKIETVYEIPEYISAPIKENQCVGKVIYKLNGDKLGESDVVVKEEIEKIKFTDILTKMLEKIFSIST